MKVKPLYDRILVKRVDPADDGRITDVEVDEDLVAHHFADVDLGLHRRRRDPRRNEGGVVDVFGTNAQDYGLPDVMLIGSRTGGRDRNAQAWGLGHQATIGAGEFGIEEVHRRGTDEPCDKHIHRMVV